MSLTNFTASYISCYTSSVFANNDNFLGFYCGGGQGRLNGTCSLSPMVIPLACSHTMSALVLLYRRHYTCHKYFIMIFFEFLNVQARPPVADVEFAVTDGDLPSMFSHNVGTGACV